MMRFRTSKISEVRVMLVRETPEPLQLIQTPGNTHDAFFKMLPPSWDPDKEHMYVQLLNTKNQLIYIDLVSMGTSEATLVDQRSVFRKAVAVNAAAIILIHNHPSGDPSPSAEDIAVTKKMIEAGRTLGIDVLDHIIVGRSHQQPFMSMREHGLVAFD